MKIRSAVLASTLATVGSLVLLLTNCSNDDTKTEPNRGARKGEACQTTNDCAPGLACIPSSSGVGVCVLGAFSVSQTAKECAIIQCEQASDCCGPPNSQCTTLADECARDVDGGAPTSTNCQLYESLCKCSNRDCENSKCITKCNTNTECRNSGLQICAGGKCVECGSDTDCGSSGTYKCVSGECQPPCKGDGDCPGFQRCLNGQCTEGACQTNRECVAATRNVEATCGTDGKCIVPCSTDFECGSPKDYKFFSCVNGQCLYLGCDSDKDCRLMLDSAIGTSSSSGSTSSSSSTTSSSTSSGSSSSGGFFTPSPHIVCRDKQSPGATTIPAH